MVFFKKPYVVRRYSKPVYVHGHLSSSYEDLKISMDVQTMDNTVQTEQDGAKSVQNLKVFCDWKLLVENVGEQQKSDQLYFQGKWFACQSSRLSENTLLRHYTATFIECLDQEEKPDLAYILEGLETPGKQEKSGESEGSEESKNPDETQEPEPERGGDAYDIRRSEGANL